MKTIRRLIVSLDGTWNNRDDSTNVLYSHSLAIKCHEKQLQRKVDEKTNETILVTQEPYYQEGVGTGPVDRITGGGFGFGLEEHVRKAYDWLVQNFQEGDGTPNCPPDEIYVFGFSRGAYTARSLVGFISMCGLLRRGAPLTVNQLWENYAILGLEREERSGGLTNKVFGKPKRKFRRITDLVWDPWLVRRSAVQPPEPVLGLRKGVELEPTEELLVRWSRRVKITYLGVYDTVGAVGWDALAIPGLRSKLAVQHNMRPTTIIQKCRHALAIDEHRSSFSHTPFVAYIGEKTGAEEMERGSAVESSDERARKLKMPAGKGQSMEQMWSERIEQRWFVGAHSNIGGGYPDNRLAQRPLEWILDGACKEGLICEKLPPVPNLTPKEAKPTDSYAQFVAPLWAMIFRAKRNYRVIDPTPELRANRDEEHNTGPVRSGFALVNINETIDSTVIDYWKESETAPPNLIEAAPRLHDSLPGRKEDLEHLAQKRVENTWPGDGYWPQLVLVLWSALAAGGLVVSDMLFCVWPQAEPSLWLLCMVAALFPFVDFLESRSNALIARDGVTPWRRAFLDSVYWTRSLGVILFAFGLVGAILILWDIGWHTPKFRDAGKTLTHLALRCGAVALSAALSTLVVNALNRSLAPDKGKRLAGIFSGPLIVAALVALTILTAHGLGHVVTAALDLAQDPRADVGITREVRIAGLLLLLQVVLVYFSRTFVWVGEPMHKANLGSITLLQDERTPEGVIARLRRWCEMLPDHHNEQTQTCAMTAIVRQALWRDAFGFIPVYSLTLLLGLWFAATKLGWQSLWTPMEYLWWMIPSAIALIDYLENLCHLHYLSLHSGAKKGKAAPNTVLTHAAFVASKLKNCTFFVCLLAVLLAVLCASGKIAFSPKLYGWRGLIGLLITAVTLLSVLGIAIWGWAYKFMERRAKK